MKYPLMKYPLYVTFDLKTKEFSATTTNGDVLSLNGFYAISEDGDKHSICLDDNSQIQLAKKLIGNIE